MLYFTSARMEQFLTGNEDHFIDFLVGHVKRACADCVRDIEPISLREMVTNALARARSHGLTRAKDLTAFVAIMFEIAPNFDEQPQIRAALADPRVPLEQRFEKMLEQVPDWAWEDAERGKVSLAWFPALLADDGGQP